MGKLEMGIKLSLTCCFFPEQIRLKKKEGGLSIQVFAVSSYIQKHGSDDMSSGTNVKITLWQVGVPAKTYCPCFNVHDKRLKFRLLRKISGFSSSLPTDQECYKTVEKKMTTNHAVHKLKISFPKIKRMRLSVQT